MFVSMVCHCHACRDELRKLGLLELLNKLQMTSMGDSTLLRYIERAQKKLNAAPGSIA